MTDHWPDADLERQMLTDAEWISAHGGAREQDVLTYIQGLLARIRRLEHAQRVAELQGEHSGGNGKDTMIEELLHVGGLMANLCHNLAQEAHAEGGKLEPRTREQMRELYHQWDELRA